MHWRRSSRRVFAARFFRVVPSAKKLTLLNLDSQRLGRSSTEILHNLKLFTFGIDVIELQSLNGAAALAPSAKLIDELRLLPLSQAALPQPTSVSSGSRHRCSEVASSGPSCQRASALASIVLVPGEGFEPPFARSELAVFAVGRTRSDFLSWSRWESNPDRRCKRPLLTTELRDRSWVDSESNRDQSP